MGKLDEILSHINSGDAEALVSVNYLIRYFLLLRYMSNAQPEYKFFFQHIKQILDSISKSKSNGIYNDFQCLIYAFIGSFGLVSREALDVSVAELKEIILRYKNSGDNLIRLHALLFAVEICLFYDDHPFGLENAYHYINTVMEHCEDKINDPLYAFLYARATTRLVVYWWDKNCSEGWIEENKKNFITACHSAIKLREPVGYVMLARFYLDTRENAETPENEAKIKTAISCFLTARDMGYTCVTNEIDELAASHPILYSQAKKEHELEKREAALNTREKMLRQKEQAFVLQKQQAQEMEQGKWNEYAGRIAGNSLYPGKLYPEDGLSLRLTESVPLQQSPLQVVGKSSIWDSFCWLFSHKKAPEGVQQQQSSNTQDIQHHLNYI